VFGPSPLLWFVPVPNPAGDGVTFPRNSRTIQAVNSSFSVSTAPTQGSLSDDDYDNNKDENERHTLLSV
jgi:hypothetical protein